MCGPHTLLSDGRNLSDYRLPLSLVRSAQNREQHTSTDAMALLVRSLTGCAGLSGRLLPTFPPFHCPHSSPLRLSARFSSSSSSSSASLNASSPSASRSLPLFDYSASLHRLHHPSRSTLSVPSLSSLPSRVRMVEVGPRDGLQNERVAVSTADKVALVDGLSECGLSVIEVGSFVSPKWVPAMSDSADVFRAIRRCSAVSYAALTPNVTGLERAMEVQASEVAVFASASESFSRANINCSVDDSLQRFLPLIHKAAQSGLRVRGYVSCVIGWSDGHTAGRTEGGGRTAWTLTTAAVQCYVASLCAVRMR